MAPSFDTVGFLTREAKLFRDLGQVLLDGQRVDAPIKRLIIAEDLFERAETGVNAAIWQLFSKIGRSLPQAERNIVAGAHLGGWRDAFRVIQGFEIQSTLLPFIRSHDVELGPGIKERFDMAAAISFAEAEAAREVRAEIADRLHVMAKPGSVIALPTTPTLPPERGIPDGASFAEFRSRDPGLYLPRRPWRPAADLDSGQRGSRLPHRPVVHRLAGRRRGTARFGRPA